MELAFAFVLGAVVGSFLNVCILRLPEGESIVSPPSHCPGCGAAVQWYDNIPIVSYCVLGGRCRTCKSPISPRYLVVEALTGTLFALLVYRFGLVPVVAAHACFVAALVVISFIDLDHQIIPDVISLPGIVIGVVLSAFAMSGAPHESLLGVLVQRWVHSVSGWGGLPPALVDSVVGLVLGGGFLWAVAEGYYALTKREGMGGGDIKLLAMVGAYLGWKNVLVTLVLGSLTGALAGGGLMLARRMQRDVPIPFGPFLAAGAVCALFFGEPLVHWYLNLALPGRAS